MDLSQFDAELHSAFHGFISDEVQRWQAWADAEKSEDGSTREQRQRRLLEQAVYSTANKMLQIALADPAFAEDLITAGNFTATFDGKREESSKHERYFGNDARERIIAIYKKRKTAKQQDDDARNERRMIKLLERVEV